MLRIFNTVRQQLVREGQLGRYIGYALGEIVLIVIGILIALQIDEWADDRSDHRFDQKTLSQIRINLQTDHEELSEILSKRREAVQSIDNILAIEDPHNPDDNLKLWLSDVMQFDRFHSLTSAYEVLKSRGLEIVRNDDLRTTLGIYYDSWAREIQQHNHDIETGFMSHWIPVIIADIQEFDWDVIAKPYNPTALLNDRRFLNTLKVEQDNHEGAAEKLETMIRINEQLQNLIDAEIQ
jgi:hypothetical protein